MPWGCGAADGMTPLQHVVNFAIHVQESSTQHAWLKSCLRTWRQPLILRSLLPQNRLMPSASNCCSSSCSLRPTWSLTRELGHLVPLWICSSWWFAFMARCGTSCATVCQWLPCCFATRFSIGRMAATM